MTFPGMYKQNLSLFLNAAFYLHCGLECLDNIRKGSVTGSRGENESPVLLTSHPEPLTKLGVPGIHGLDLDTLSPAPGFVSQPRGQICQRSALV